jgi:glycosyltransferase involved in cell wall biosynthesis
MLEQISVTMLTKNSQRHLEASLKALEAFDEVLVLDNGSTDSTIEIAKSFSNVTLIKHDFIGFGALKNLAAQKAKNDWILSIDSDEIVTPKLIEKIKQLDSSKINTLYSFPRLNHYRGKVVKCCGWSPDIVRRLYNKTYTRFSDAQVHESLITPPDSITRFIDAELWHYPFESAEELIEKMQRYSTLYALQSDKPSSPIKAFSRASFGFFKNFFLQKGFLYGYEGLLISVSNANGIFYKYMKIYEKQKAHK